MTALEWLVCAVVECGARRAEVRWAVGKDVPHYSRERRAWQDSPERAAWLATMGIRWIPGRLKPY